MEAVERSNDFLNHRPVLIPPAALMIAKSEVLLHGREGINAAEVALGNFSLAGTRVEGEIDVTT